LWNFEHAAAEVHKVLPDAEKNKTKIQHREKMK